jgi:hypothetical protein
VLQEAVSSLDRAYDYFLAVGDDLQLSKTLSRIAEVYLDHLFVHVALLRVPYEERSVSPPPDPQSAPMPSELC